MSALAVIENLDVLDDIARRFPACCVMSVIHEFRLSVPQKLSIGALS